MLQKNSLNTFVFASPVHYFALAQRHQSLAQEFSATGSQIVYINPLQGGGFSVKRTRINRSLTTIDIKVPLRAAKYPAIQRILNKLAFKLLQKSMCPNLHQTIFWVADPLLASWSAKTWKQIFYDRCDLHGHFPGQKAKAWQHYEELLTKKVDMVFVSHPYLKRTLPEDIQNKTFEIPNAAKKYKKHATRTRGNAKLPLKLISSGAHFEWVDSLWLKTFAQLPEFELHVAGPGRGAHFLELISMKEVNYHGTLNHEKLQNLLEEMDIGLIPFLDLELIKGVDPIKAYEFAAAGLEIWAPTIETLRSNKLISKFLENGKEAVESLRIDSADGIELHKNIELIPTWQDRAETILDRISKLDTKY